MIRAGRNSRTTNSVFAGEIHPGYWSAKAWATDGRACILSNHSVAPGINASKSTSMTALAARLASIKKKNPTISALVIASSGIKGPNWVSRVTAAQPLGRSRARSSTTDSATGLPRKAPNPRRATRAIFNSITCAISLALRAQRGCPAAARGSGLRL